MKKTDEMDEVRDAIQVCRDCERIASVLASASLPALADVAAWDALEEYEKAVKDGPAYKAAHAVGGAPGTAWRVMHDKLPPERGRERMEHALRLEGLWHSLHPDAKPTVIPNPETPGVRVPRTREIWDYDFSRTIGNEPRLYFASFDYFFGPVLLDADGRVTTKGICSHVRGIGSGRFPDGDGWQEETAHLGKSFRFMGRALAAQAGEDWPGKASPLAVRFVGAIKRAGGGKPERDSRTRGNAIPGDVKKAVLDFLEVDCGGDVKGEGWKKAYDRFLLSTYYTPNVQKYVTSVAAMKRIAKAARTDAQRRKAKLRTQKK